MSSINIIPNAKDKFNKLLKFIKAEENILQYYDNVTYNIRFYMLPSSLQYAISKKREDSLFASYSIPDKDKIIIAESGVTSRYSIESLKIDTIYTNTSISNSAVSYSLNLHIKEVNSCQLINQIAVISKILGYESYILQPFHIDIWFSGYENETHKPVQIIPEVGVLTYEVIMNEVKTNVDVSGTNYNFTCTCAGINSTSKDIIAIGDIGQISNVQGLTLEQFRNELVKKVNEKYFNINKELKKYYNNDYLNIRLIDLDEFNADIYKKSTNSLNSNFISQSLSNAKLLNSIYGDSNDSNNESGIRPSTDDSLSNIFQKFCLNSNELKDYNAKPIFKVIHINNKEGLTLCKIQIDVIFSKNNYMNYFNDRFNNLNNIKTASELNQYEYSMMLEHLITILGNNLLIKKYEWLFNGHDTSVLEVNSSIDKLWLSNIPFADGIDSIINNTSEYFNVYNNEVKNLINNEENDFSLNEISSLSTFLFNNVRTLANDKRLYINDIYNCVDDKLKSSYLNSRVIYEKNPSASPTYPEQSADSNTVSIVAKTGYNNIFSTGNLLKLNIKILGDPYWLKLFSDSIIYENRYNDVGNMHYFIFKMNTTLDQSEDGTFKKENVVDFCNIYQIIKSVSIFENGKFIQDLEAIISPEFLTLGRLEI